MFADASGARGFEFLPERDFVEVIQYSNESFKALTFGFSRIRHSTYPKHSTLQLFLAQTQNFAICLWGFVGLWSKVKRGSVALNSMTRWKVASFNIRMQTQEMDPNDNWDVRKDALVEELVKSNLAIIGMQETGWWEFSFWQYRYRGWGLAGLLCLNRLSLDKFRHFAAWIWQTSPRSATILSILGFTSRYRFFNNTTI